MISSFLFQKDTSRRLLRRIYGDKKGSSFVTFNDVGVLSNETWDPERYLISLRVQVMIVSCFSILDVMI